MTHLGLLALALLSGVSLAWLGESVVNVRRESTRTRVANAMVALGMFIVALVTIIASGDALAQGLAAVSVVIGSCVAVVRARRRAAS